MANIPCPPFYSAPTYISTPVYSTDQFVRHYNDWYRCLVGPYCNAPSFLGYNPPGEGELWTEAWTFVETSLRFECNPALETTDVLQQDLGGLILTKKPTNSPTSQAESPAVISGTVWYDANADGRRNDPNSALTDQDFLTSEKERGAGVGNLKVLLRTCDNDDTREALGVTYTFPSGQNVNNGKAEVFDAAYLQKIQNEDFYSEGADDVKIGYYSFRILPNQIPGDFYLVFEAPFGYKLTGGSGLYWEVGEEALEDQVLPMVDGNVGSGTRYLQLDNATETVDANEPVDTYATMSSTAVNEIAVNTTIVGSNETGGIISNLPTNKPTAYVGYDGYIPKLDKYINSFDFEVPIKNASTIGPITHSGYYARSRCISIKTNRMVVDEIDAGMSISQWPLTPFQYSSFVVTFSFFEQASITRQLQNNLDCETVIEGASLECRLYQKMKCDGVKIADEWGCEEPINTGPLFVVEELTMEQGGVVVQMMTEFLSLGSGEFTLSNVGLAHQNVVLLDENQDRRQLDTSLRHPKVHNSRSLQNAEVARLELGFRIQGESETPSQEELTNILLQSISDDSETLLSGFKAGSGLPEYMKYAGEITARRVFDVPKPKKVTIDTDSSADESESGGAAVTPGAVIGIIIGVLLLGILSGLLIYRRMKDDDDSDSDSSDSSDYSSDSEGPSRDRKVVKQVVREYNDDDSDSLSSRWYSDYEGSDAEDEPFDVKEAFYRGMMKPAGRPSVRARSAGSSARGSSRRSNSSSVRSSKESNAASRNSSRRSHTSSRTGGSSRGSSRLNTGMSMSRGTRSRTSGSSRGSSRLNTGATRVSSALSQGTQSAVSSVMSAGSRSQFSNSTRSSFPSKTSSSLQTGPSRSTRSSYPSRTSQSTRSSFPSRTSQSTRSNASSRPSSRYSEASSRMSSQNSSRVSMTSGSMGTHSQSSTRSMQNSMKTTSTDGSSRG
ncbi:hypothetical protein ACHAWO_001601 [Cyclotella atomus]|uniref:Uncharacterized protein n=1 Tax=Cyclotella atomus TaxID=382360 RepID=A0ABD3P1J1_9STRA